MFKEQAFEQLHRMVLDENKIVTFKKLSSVLNVELNEARSYLDDFFSKYCKDEKLSSYHLIIGSQVNGDGGKSLKAVIAPEDELEAVKSTFSSITSYQLYCIQKKRHCINKFELYSTDHVDTEGTDNKRAPTITNPQINVHPGKQTYRSNICNNVGERKPFSKTMLLPEKKEVPSSLPVKEKTPNLFTLFSKKDESKNSTSSTKTNKSEVSPESSKPKSNNLFDAKKKQNSSKSTKSTGSKGDVISLFTKQSERNASKPVVKQPVESLSKITISPVEELPKAVSKISMKDDDDDFEQSEPKKVTNSKRKTTKSVSKKNPKRNLRLSSDDSDSEKSMKPKKKKHRRIATFDDSDSASENEEANDRALRDVFSNESDSVIKNTADDDDEIIPPTPVESGKKAKVLKLVSKTFQDEEGFFVTKKIKEYVTASEEESENEESKNPKPSKIIPALNKKSPVTATKQSSLMSFFKQK